MPSTKAWTCASAAARSARSNRCGARSPGRKSWITGQRRAQAVDPGSAAAGGTRRGPRPGQVQSARRLERGRGLGLSAPAPGALQPALRPGLPVDRLRALHAAHGRRRGRARRALVVGRSRRARMRTAPCTRWAPGSSQGNGVMSAVLEGPPHCEPPTPPLRSHLDWLESEAIHILREVAGEAANPVLFFSGGKDSIVLLRLAEKAFRPARFPFPLLHIDTGHNFPEVIAFRDRRAARTGRAPDRALGRGLDAARHGAAALGDRQPQRRAVGDPARGDRRVRLRRLHRRRAPRRGKGARQGAHLLLPRRIRPVGSRRTSGPNSGACTTRACTRASTCACFPISNWTELDVWQYIARERLEVPSIYYAHRRPVVRRNGLLVPVTELTPPRDGEAVEEASVRFRTVGDISCTCPVESDAATVEAIIAETVQVDGDRARRHPHGRPDLGRVHGAAQEGRVFLGHDHAGRTRASPRGARRRGRSIANTHGVLRFITAGSVDDGKSTLIGRLLHDSRAILEDQLAAVAARLAQARQRGNRPVAAHRRPRGRARAGHHHRRRLPLLRHAAAQVHHRRFARPRAVHPQHGDRGLDRGRGGDPGRCAQGHPAADQAPSLPSPTCSASATWSSP